MITFPNCEWGFNRSCNHSVSMVWKKWLAEDTVAFLLMNNRNTTSNVNISWRADMPPSSPVECPPAGCLVRDIHAHKDLGPHPDGFVAKDLAPHDSAFIVVTTTTNTEQLA